MSTETIQKYKTINPVNDETTTHAMMQMLVDANKGQLASFFGASAGAGRFYLFKTERFPGMVLEYVPGNDGSDSVSTLCTEHPIFASRQALIDAREELIGAIERVLMAVPNTTVVRDNGRERDCFLTELGTVQLLDTLIHFNQSSPLIVAA
jgi:hypothetical protein